MPLTHASPLAAVPAVVLDTETTGLDSRSARIVQIGAIRLADGALEPDPAIDVLVDPGAPIPKATTAVHGITDDMVRGKPAFPDLVPELDRLLDGSVLIGHSTAYDLAMLEREYKLAERPWRQPRALDIRLLARIAVPTLADHSLDRLCEWTGVAIEGRHTAVGDARATAEVFLALVPLLRSKNIRTLAEAEAACRRLSGLEASASGQLVSPSDIAPADASPALIQLDSFAYQHRVRDVMSTPAAFVPAATPLRDVMAKLIRDRISSVLVQRSSGDVAIATERDLLRALDAGGADAFHAPIESVAKGPIETVRQEAFLYRAIGRIGRLGFRHLGVTDASGAIVGIVTTRNLLRHRSSTALMLGDEITSASNAATLASAWAKLPRLAETLMRDGVDAPTIADVISSEIRAFTRRAAKIAEQHLQAEGLGVPPVPYAVLVLGSGGRGESLLSSDQDNAIVYASGVEGGPEDRYFEALGRHMNDLLDATGLVRCSGGVMAGNRKWRMSATDWRDRIDGWIRRHSPDDLLDADIFFDAFAVHGDRALGDGIWHHAYEQAHASIDFQKQLTELARQKAPAFTLLGGFRVDEAGRIDLKKAGLMPLFTCARVLSIRHDIHARSTPERLNPLPGKGIGSTEIIATILAAQRELMTTILRQQLADIQAGIPPSAKVAPARLSKAERRDLKTALQAIDEIIGLAAEGRI